jgi:starch synthase
MAKKPTPSRTKTPVTRRNTETKGKGAASASSPRATNSEVTPDLSPAASPTESEAQGLPKAQSPVEQGGASKQVSSTKPAETPSAPTKPMGGPSSPQAAEVESTKGQVPPVRGSTAAAVETRTPGKETPVSKPVPSKASTPVKPGVEEAVAKSPTPPAGAGVPPAPPVESKVEPIPVVSSAPESEVSSSPEPSAEQLAEPPVEQAVELDVEPRSEMLPEADSGPEPEPYFEPRPSLFIVHVTPEMAPVAKVGGLADVVFGLSRELAIRGNHVEVILPKYDNLRYDHIFEMHEVFRDLWVPWYDGAIHCTVYFSFVHDRKCFFIEPHSQDNFFNRGSLYGFRDDVLRFAFFSRAAIEFLWQSGKHPDVIHCHDWQTALVPVFLYEIYQQLGMHHPRVCLTIHNFKHQGVTGPDLLNATGLHRPERFMAHERLGDNHHRGALNLLKGGIVYSNFVSTVSPRYAYESKDQGQGFGLEPTLHTHHMKYGGVVNGVDYDVWNPAIDHHLPVQYDAESIDGKYESKRALRNRLMLVDNEKPIVAFIGRLDPQKGLELVRHAIFYSLGRGAQFVLLGSSPDHGINADFWGLKQMLNDNPDCHLEIGFDEDLSHLIYAGADMILVPSQFEPCGLTQLIALRYGTIPVVRSVGGLADTVFDKDHSYRPLHERNGYSFETYDNLGLESALGRAIDCYYNYPDHFRELMKNAMRSDYSWNHPGQDYLNIYDFIREH